MELSHDELQDLLKANAYHARKANVKVIRSYPKEVDGRSPVRPGAHIFQNHRQGRAYYSESGLWCFEEALRTRDTLLAWKGMFRLRDITKHSLVSEGLTRLIDTEAEPDYGLLGDIMTGDSAARIGDAEVERAMKSDVGLFAVSYRHQGPKGSNITRELWSEIIRASNSVARSAGFQSYSLWIDSISAAAKRKKGNADYVDWFTIGVAPYILLPTILLADEPERRERMWLRLEERLSQFGPCGVYAIRHRGRIVRLEPGPTELRERHERIWCLCQSVLRGEYNGLLTTCFQDYISLLKWAVDFERMWRSSPDYRGLREICGPGSDVGFQGELPIEKGCYIVQEAMPEMPWLYGAELFSGKLEYFRLTKENACILGIGDEGRTKRVEEQLLILKMKNGKMICMYQSQAPEAQKHIQQRRWRSFADSTLLLGEIGFAKSGTQALLLRTILVGAVYESCDVLNVDWIDRRLEVIPDEARMALGINDSEVESMEKVKVVNLYAELSAIEKTTRRQCLTQ